MSWICLLCGYTGEEASSSDVLACCSWCSTEAASLHPSEVSALRKIEQIKPYFRVWDKGRREDSSGRCSDDIPPQPARVFRDLPLYIGDMDDAADVIRLQELEIGCVVNLCAQQMSGSYQQLPLQLAQAGIHQHILVADDSRNFDILDIACRTFPIIDDALKTGTGNNGVLVHCWGGVNRSGAIVVAFLAQCRGVPLSAAIDHTMKARGTVLTNQSFVKQLVRYCFKKGLNLESSDVPPDVYDEYQLMQTLEMYDVVPP